MKSFKADVSNLPHQHSTTVSLILLYTGADQAETQFKAQWSDGISQGICQVASSYSNKQDRRRKNDTLLHNCCHVL